MMNIEMMNISRRDFLEGGVAFGGLAATSTLLAFADETNGRRLRIGILSDIHLMERYAAEKFERALLAFRKGRVNGVLICGDAAFVPVALDARCRAEVEVSIPAKGNSSR